MPPRGGQTLRPWKGGTQGGGGGLDTFPPVPPSTGLGESPQNSGEKKNLTSREIEDRDREIETEMKEAEKAERVWKKYKKEKEWKKKRDAKSEISSNKEKGSGEEKLSTDIEKEKIENIENASTRTVRTVKPKISPGIEKIKKVFEKETETDKKKVETINKVQKIKNSFEMLMDPRKRDREAGEERDRERLKKERKVKREQKQKKEIIVNRVTSIRDRLKLQAEKKEETECGGELWPWRKGGIIRNNTDPGDKRKRECDEKDKEEGISKVRREEWGRDKNDKWWGKIQYLDEPGEGGLKVKSDTISNRTSNTRCTKQTELNKLIIDLPKHSERHGDHSERIDLKKKRKMSEKSEEVQELKGEGGSGGHLEKILDKKPEKKTKEKNFSILEGGQTTKLKHVVAIPNRKK